MEVPLGELVSRSQGYYAHLAAAPDPIAGLVVVRRARHTVQLVASHLGQHVVHPTHTRLKPGLPGAAASTAGAWRIPSCRCGRGQY